MRPARALALRGLSAGALAGALAAVGDHLLSRGDVARFLPGGTGHLLLFLVALYAGLGALAGLLAGLAARLVDRASDLGRLAGNAIDGGEPVERGLWAMALGWPVPLLLLGALVRLIATFALHRFHAHLPIAAVVGLATTGLLVPTLVLAFVLGRLLDRLLRFGPRLKLAVGGAVPAGWMLPWWLLGLGLGAVAVLLQADAVQLRPRMSLPVRALNIALWAPVLSLGALALGHLLGRLSWRLARRWLDEASWLGRALRRPLPVAVLGLSLAAGGATLGLGLTWSVAKVIVWRPVLVAAIAAAAFLLLAALGLGRAWDGRRRLAQAAAAVAVPLVLLLLAGALARPDRVRKAAFSTGLAPPLITSLQRVADLDADRYPSTLALGSDCDDRDASVHPGAFDWPDDGIDQNCNGHQATTKARPRPPATPIPPSVPRPLNFVLLTIDAVRDDHVGAYGYPRPTTPSIDALARESVVFKNGWAHSPSTRYSVPAILIGRTESSIAWDARAHWPPLVLPENRLISEALKERGYRTAALTPAHYFEPGWGLTQGFDEYDNSLARLHANPFHGDPAKATGSSSREMTDLALGWLARSLGQPTPFFLWLHYYDPHYLYERHPEVPSFGEREIDLYDAEIRFTDLHVGRFLDALRRSPDWERTVVVVTADHGEGFGEHGVNLHGYHIYAQQNRVPFIVRVPGVAPRVVDEPAGHTDLFPTFLDLIGAPGEEQLQGESLVDLMLGGQRPRMVFGEVEYEGPVVRKSVVSRDWHLIHNVVPDDTFELYHISTDRQEERDLFGTGAPEEDRLRAALAEWMDQSALPPRFAERVAGNLSPTPFPVAQRLDARIGEWLAVEGATLAAPRVRRGQAVEVSMVLRALRPAPSGWRMFTHLVARGGRFINADHDPVEGFVPLGKLRPGQYVRDNIKVVVPADWPPGPLEVTVGLWKGAERAPVSTGADHLTIATVEVVP